MSNQGGFFKTCKYILLVLTLLVFLTPLWVSKEFLFPFITTKAFYLRILVEMGLPFFIYMLVVQPDIRPAYKNPLHVSIAAFWLINLVSAFAGVDWHKAIWGNFERMGGVFYLSHLILLYFYIVVLAKVDFAWLKRICDVNICLATLLSIYGIILKVFAGYNGVSLNSSLSSFGLPPDPSLPDRVSATFGNPIFFPSYLIPVLFLTLFWAFRRQGKLRYFYFAAAFLQVLAIFASVTRGAVAGLIIGGFIAAVAGLLVSPSGKIKTWGLVSAVAVLTFGIVLYLNSSRLPDGTMFKRIFQLKDSNSSARLIQWRVALSGFKDYPIFGVGAENYYVIGNKYFNPEIYQYDGSWFDKPHNYLLEVLVTNGLAGFAAYLSMLGFCAWGFYKAWRYEAISLAAFIALLAGLLVYQIQNLFVFDTVSASMSFYIFLAVAGFLWEKLLEGERQVKNKKAKILLSARLHSFGLATFPFSIACVVYVLWAFNFTPLAAARDVNYGYAYGSVGNNGTIINPQTAENYFEKALTQAFNFDNAETVGKYQEFALNFLQTRDDKTKDFSNLVAKKAMAALESVAEANPNQPIIWQKLASLYLNYAYANQTALDPRTKDALDKAVALAPERTEAMAVLLQLDMLSGKYNDALALGNKIITLNPGNLDGLWQLSLVEKQVGNMDKAIKYSEILLAKNYKFSSPEALNWLIDYYKNNKDWDKVAVLLTKDIKLDPNNINYYFALVEADFLGGHKQAASELASQLTKADPSLQNKLSKYIIPASIPK